MTFPGTGINNILTCPQAPGLYPLARLTLLYTYLWQRATDFDTLGTSYLILSILKISDFTAYKLENTCELCISIVPTNESQLQLWVRWQTYSTYFQNICTITNWLCLYLKILYVTNVNPSFFNWPEGFRKFFRPEPKGTQKFIEVSF